ncbi:hypothetical protein RRG08_043589 [Elysia crispata]|uniref:peptidylprolyl isomerase n=1 Tax=Elysia crispata TaxID=231223 RepID=A0AAE1DU31_9GAST|nr:hypothetical protein RRG08_043589 [Elysia crispata]
MADVFSGLGEEEISTRLKGALDLTQLRDPQGNGVEFELDEDHLNTNQEEPEISNVTTFDKNQVASNICALSDNEDEDEDENESGGEYLTEMQRLERRMKKLEDSDITPAKDCGVLKQRKTLGVGSVIPEGSLVKIHYNAYTDIGQAPYDSTRLRGEEYKVRLGKGQLIPGLEMAILTMRKHELSRFLVRPEYAYGEHGCPPRIPPGATLIFDVEIISFVDQEGVDDYYSLTPEERKARLTYANIEKVVKAENNEAKEYFEQKNYHKAFGKYKRAANILENYHLKSDEEEKQWSKQLLKVYVNSAICCHHIKHFGRCISYCNQAIKIDRTSIKAHYFKGKALHGMGKFDDAKESLRRARNLDPSNTMVSKALQALAKSIKDHELFEKDMYKKMFSRPTSATASENPSDTNQNQEKATQNSHGTCSEGFRAIVKEQLEKFQKDTSMTEMPFPQIPMTEAEIECILSTAAEMGMNVQSKGTGSSLRYEVYKKTAP